MFPSEAYRKLCIENEKILRDEYKTRGLRFGDLVLCWHGDDKSWGDDLWIVISWYTEDAIDVIRDDGACGPVLLNELLPLFTLHQLIEMLEERGREHALMWDLWGPRSFEPEKRYMLEVTSRLGKMKVFGPDPATALLKAYLEMVSQGGKEE